MPEDVPMYGRVHYWLKKPIKVGSMTILLVVALDVFPRYFCFIHVVLRSKKGFEKAIL